MTRPITLLLPLVLLASCGKPAEAPQESSVSFNIDRDRITVSGISSGAYMAGQLHIAHSASIRGAALLAGGPYWCAEGSMQKGLGPCIKGGDIGLDTLIAFARDQAAAGTVDALENLADDKVFLFHGTLDVAVARDVVYAAKAFYEQVAPESEIVLVDDVEVVHGMPTLDKGVACTELAAPFLNACGYDAAGALLAALYGPLEARATATGELQEIGQPGADAAEMLGQAFLYVPASCAAGESCGVHVAFHGCQQSAEFVGDAFARDAGYNEWAEANDLLVLYPQVASSKIAPLNPLGCWDWWGYTDENYATRSGAQVTSVVAMIEALSAASH